MNTAIHVLGHQGRMGSLTCAEIAARTDCVYSGDMESADVVIDFTRADATPDLLARAVRLHKPYVCCVTGLDPAPLRATSEIVPVLHAVNTSVSLAVFKRAVADIAASLRPHGYTVAIHDVHHAAKRDAPSGTALALGAAIGGPVSYTSERMGKVVGEHTVTFTGAHETIALRHAVTDRRVFARGALEAAIWLAKQPAGFYGMDDVLF
ncbi:MAG: hypothetical protein H6865_01095 [Rhodospirillales bacterium]|nr:hypothetical protein [Alphaproteobacteria bacterium]MCB9986222.1 hypothetical protein [Rhodospirillales bacterium]USO07222.1 MAG: hypothetical protein H6866_07275 [Rhodospirillales bacterium]